MTPKISLSSQKRRVRMRDVAARAGVSISTVSLVLSGDTRIPEDTTRKVLQTVKAMEYRPSNLARSLARRGSRTIGVILPESAFTTNQPFYYQTLEGIHGETQPAGYKMLVEAATRAFLDRRYYLRLLKEQSVDAILYLAASVKDTFLNEMARENYPFVLLTHRPSEAGLPYIGAEESKGARMAVDHLLRLGHTRIGFVGGSADFWTGFSREQGYRQAMSLAKIDVASSWVVSGDSDAAKAASLVHDLLKAGVTAIFAANDWMAAGVLKGLWQAGKRVPNDVAVVGMDDLPISELTTPPLTTIRVGIREQAALATRYLLASLSTPASQRPPLPSLYTPELIVRSSCGSK